MFVRPASLFIIYDGYGFVGDPVVTDTFFDKDPKEPVTRSPTIKICQLFCCRKAKLICTEPLSYNSGSILGRYCGTNN